MTLHLEPDNADYESVQEYLIRTEPIDDAKLIAHYVAELGWQGLADHSIEHDPLNKYFD